MNVLVLCRYRQCLSSTTCLWTYLPDLILRNFTLVWKVRGNTVSNKMYKVEWEGGHQSSYPLEWLKERSFREEARTLYREKVINQACGCPPKMKIKFFWALYTSPKIIYWGNWFPKILAMSIDASWCRLSVSKWEDLQANQITNFSFLWFEIDLYVNGKLVIRKGPKQFEQGYKFLPHLCDIKD